MTIRLLFAMTVFGCCFMLSTYGDDLKDSIAVVKAIQDKHKELITTPAPNDQMVDRLFDHFTANLHTTNTLNGNISGRANAIAVYRRGLEQFQESGAKLKYESRDHKAEKIETGAVVVTSTSQVGFEFGQKQHEGTPHSQTYVLVPVNGTWKVAVFCSGPAMGMGDPTGFISF